MSKQYYASNCDVTNFSIAKCLAMIANHLEDREEKEHSNEMIDTSRTSLNRTYKNPTALKPTKEQIAKCKQARNIQEKSAQYSCFVSTLTISDCTNKSPEWIKNHSWDKIYSKPKEQAKFIQDVNKWYDLKLQMLQERFGDRLVRVDLHMDETNPHLHAIIINWDEKQERFNTRDKWNNRAASSDFNFCITESKKCDLKFCDNTDTNFKYDLTNRDGRITPVNKKKQSLADLKANDRVFLSDSEVIDKVNKSKYVNELSKRTATKQAELDKVRSEVVELKKIKEQVNKWADPNYVKEQINKNYDLATQKIKQDNLDKDNEIKKLKEEIRQLKNKNWTLERDFNKLDTTIENFLSSMFEYDLNEEFDKYYEKFNKQAEAGPELKKPTTAQDFRSSTNESQNRGGQGGQ